MPPRPFEVGDIVRWNRNPASFCHWWPVKLGAGPFLVVSVETISIHVKSLDGSLIESRKIGHFHNGAVELDPFLSAAYRVTHGKI